MILVTGGTGLVGAHLLFALLQKHQKVRATHRAGSDLESVLEVFSYYTKNPQEYYHKIEWVMADITQVPALTHAFNGITHVYHCAAYIHFDPKKYYLLKKANIEGTANIVNLSLANSIEKLCYVSSIATLGETLDDTAIDETNDWNPEADNNVYAITKYGAEMEVWRGIQEGLNAVIVNPGVILGEGYWHSGSGVIVQRAAKGLSYYPTGGTGFVDVKDVVRAMLLLMESAISNERYILVGHNLQFKELLTLFSRYFKTPPPRKKISKRLLLLASKLDGLSSFLLGTKRRLLKPMVTSMYFTARYNATKIEKDFNLSFTSIQTTVERIVKNYI